MILSWLLVAWAPNSFANNDERDATYPQKSVHLVVPFPAGGGADIVARLVAHSLAQKLGQAVVVDNKPGADGTLAAQHVASSPADGYTLFFATYGAMSAAPFLHRDIHYNPSQDFTPISAAGKFSMFLFIHPDLPVNSVQQLIDYEHTHPGKINYGTGNVASLVMSSELREQAHLRMTHVPYKGEVPAMVDFLAGRIQVMFATPTNTLPYVKEGRLKALASMSDKRSSLLPEVMTWRESGMPAMDLSAWAGFFGPAHLPVNITNKLSALINQILLEPEVRAEFSKQGFEPSGSSPAALSNYLKAQARSWQSAIQSASLQPE